MIDTTGQAAGSRADTFARYGLFAGAVGFAVLFLLAIALTPSGFAEEELPAYVAAVADNLDGLTAPLWLWPILGLLGVPAVLAVGRVARSKAPALGLTGLILAFGLAIPIGIDWDELTYAALDAGLDQASVVVLLDSVEDLPSSMLGFLFFPGLLGVILLGVAILRGRSAPLWAGIALIAGPILVPVTWFSGVMPLLAAAWAVLGAGMIGGALPLLRPPAGPAPTSESAGS